MGIFQRKENPFYIKIKRALKVQDKIKTFDKIIYLGGFQDDEKNNQRFRELLKVSPISAFESLDYNAQENNIELYYFEDSKSAKYYLLMLLDPVELFATEKIIEIIDLKKMDYSDIKHEIIYP